MASCTYNCFMNVINIGNSIIGVSILAMPYCFRKCGILLSLVLMVISGLLTKLACFFILKSAVMARRRSFEFLAFHSFGSYGKLAVEMGIIGFLIGVCIAFFVVIGDLGPPLAAEFLNIENGPNLRTNVLMLVGLCVALPLGLLRKIDSLTSLSALSIAFYVCLILKIFAEAVPNLSENEWWFEVNWWRSEGILPCLPIFSMALSCQTQLFEFFDTSNEPSLKKMQSVIDGAVCLCSAVYLMVGIFGYIAFHDKNITGNILILLTPSVVTEIIKLGFLLTVAVSFPLCLFPCRSSLHSLLFKPGFVHHDHVNTIPDHRFRILTVSLVMVTIGIAIMLPNIEFVLGIIGSTIGTLICLILPAMIFIQDSNKMTYERRKAQILFGIGVFILIACTFSTLHENNNRDKTLPVEVPKIQKITPAPVLILSTASPAIIQSPKILLKETPLIQEKKKLEILELKVEDQKRQEPPIPQEPEVKANQHADLDPQALQKEDKEIQKEDKELQKEKDAKQVPANLVSTSNKVDGLDKQEQVLKKLEEQQEQQKQILIEQKQILEELKQHKQSHEEMKRNELLEKQEISIKNQVVAVPTPVIPKQDSLKVPRLEPVLNVQEEHKIIEDIKPEKVPEKKIEFKPPLSFSNISVDVVSSQKVLQDLENNRKHQKTKLSNDEKLVMKQQVDLQKFNASVDVKQNIQKVNKNVSVNNVLKNNAGSPNSPPTIRKDTLKLVNVEKNDDVHIKLRETLENKPEFEATLSKDIILDNTINNKNDRT